MRLRSYFALIDRPRQGARAEPGSSYRINFDGHDGPAFCGTARPFPYIDYGIVMNRHMAGMPDRFDGAMPGKRKERAPSLAADKANRLGPFGFCRPNGATAIAGTG